MAKFSLSRFGLPGTRHSPVVAVEQQATSPSASALAHVPPTQRQIRAQAVHRLQVGLFGLAGMLLLVSLANVIMDRAKYIDESAVNVATPVVEPSETSAKDPLADMGVAPKLPVSTNEKPAATATANAPSAPLVTTPEP